MEKIKEFFNKLGVSTFVFALTVMLIMLLAACFAAVFAFLHFFKKYPAETSAFLVLIFAIIGRPGRWMSANFSFKNFVKMNRGKYPNPIMKPAGNYKTNYLS